MTSLTPSSFVNLGRDEAGQEFLYHALELVGIQDSLSLLLTRLDESLGSDPERVADVLGRIEVEVFHHLAYHLREIRPSFTVLLKREFGPDTEIVVDEP